jgi:hypothetical protein
MQRANLDGQNLCSQIYGRDSIPEPPCHSIFKRRGGGGVRNWARISRAVRIKAPRSTTLKRFRTPFSILPLIKGGGGGVRNGGVSRKGPIPVVSPFVSFSSLPDRAPRLVPFSSSLSSDICPSLADVTKGCDHSLMHKALSRFRDSCGRSSCHLHLPISETPKWSKPADVTRGLTRVEYCHVSL